MFVEACWRVRISNKSGGADLIRRHPGGPHGACCLPVTSIPLSLHIARPDGFRYWPNDNVEAASDGQFLLIPSCVLCLILAGAWLDLCSIHFLAFDLTRSSTWPLHYNTTDHRTLTSRPHIERTRGSSSNAFDFWPPVYLLSPQNR